MKTKNDMLVVVAILIAFVALPLQAQVSLPFSDGFESGTNAATYTSADWTYGHISATATNTAKTGSLALYSLHSATLAVEAGKMWFNYYTIMNPVDIAADGYPTIGTDAAAFFMDTDGAIHAYSNNTYVVVTNGLNTSAWHSFSVQLDFDNDKWNLFYKGPSASASDPYVPLNSSPLAFNTDFGGGAVSSEIEVSGETYLDDVVTEVSIFAATSSYANVSTVPLILDGAASGISFEYLGTNGSLYGILGDLLENVFSADDQLHLWDAATSNWVVSTLQSGELSGWDTDFEITPTTGFFIKRVGAPKSTSVSIPHGETFSHTGSLTEIVEGWNLLTIPHTAVDVALSASGLPVADGDRVFLWSDGRWLMDRRLSGAWQHDLTLPAGRTFWLFSGSGGNWSL